MGRTALTVKSVAELYNPSLNFACMHSTVCLRGFPVLLFSLGFIALARLLHRAAKDCTDLDHLFLDTKSMVGFAKRDNFTYKAVNSSISAYAGQQCDQIYHSVGENCWGM